MIPAHQFNNVDNKRKKRKFGFEAGLKQDEEHDEEISDDNSNNNNDFEEEEEEIFLDNNSNTSSSVSSSSSSSSVGNPTGILKLKKNRIKHGHKMLILCDENNEMSDALQDLQIEVDSHPNDYKIMPIKEEDDSDSEQIENENFKISDQLREKLKEYQSYDDFILSKLKNQHKNTNSNNLQLIIWEPPRPLSQMNEETSENSSDPIDDQISTNYYTVEEPVDETLRPKKSKLKRSHSQITKIPIEEIKNLNNISNTGRFLFSNSNYQPQQPQAVQFYVVDEFEDDQAQKQQQQSVKVSSIQAERNLNIRDVTNEADSDFAHQPKQMHYNDSYEKMDI